MRAIQVTTRMDSAVLIDIRNRFDMWAQHSPSLPIGTCEPFGNEAASAWSVHARCEVSKLILLNAARIFDELQELVRRLAAFLPLYKF